MKIDYDSFGSFTITAEDGRDVAWFKAMADNMEDDLLPILEQQIKLMGEESISAEEKYDEITFDDVKKGYKDIHSFEFSPFGELASPYDFAVIKETYEKMKPSVKKWCASWKEKGKVGREDAVGWWNKNYPDEQI